MGDFHAFEEDSSGFERLHNSKQIRLLPVDRTAHFYIRRLVDGFAVPGQLRRAERRAEGR